MVIVMKLGLRLKNEREKRNWSQKYVADKVGITNAVLSNYERDIRDPDTETLRKLSDLFEVSVDYLLGRTNNPNLFDDNPISVSFRDGGKDISEEEAEYLEQQLKQFREWRKKFQQEK